MEGGSIGLELTGAVARPFMLIGDQLDKNSVRKAGMNIMMYEWYIDDSNQVATVPPPSTRYDRVTRKGEVDDNQVDELECDDERTARVMTDIANSLMPGIIMEFDVPSRNPSKKMPILDMEVWIDEEGNIMFQH